MTTKAQLEREDGLERLREILKPGDTVYTILRHVSQSGMSRQISPVVIKDGKPDDISWEVAKLGLWKRKFPHDSLTIGGCGMDMGFHVVYEMSHLLFPDGFKVEGVGRNGDTSGWDRDGGYALKQQWL